MKPDEVPTEDELDTSVLNTTILLGFSIIDRTWNT